MKKTNPYFRVFAIFIMLALLVWGPWWLTWIIALVFLFLFPLYYEIILWGVLYDSLYGGGMSYTFTVSSIILFIVTYYLRKQLLAYGE